MANGSFEFETGNRYITGRIVWSSTSNGSSANTSNVSATLSFKKSSSSTSATTGTFNGNISIDGTATSFSKVITLNANNTWVTIGTATRTVGHNSDGTKSIKILSSGGIGSLSFNYTNQGQTVVLDTIPRASAIKCDGGDIGTNTTVVIDRKSSVFTHTLTYTFGNLSGTIATKTAYTNVNFALTSDMYSQIPNSNSGIGTITCVTYSGASEIGTTTCQFTARVTNSNPTMGTYSYQDTNPTTIAITQDNQRIIRNNSTLAITVGAAMALNSSSISQYKVVFNGVTKTRSTAGTFDFGAINLGNNSVAEISVIDSRGNTTTAKKEIIIDNWELPTALVTLERQQNYYSETNINVNGTFSSLNDKNSVTIQCQYKKVAEQAYSEWQTLTNNQTTVLTLDNLYQWDVRVKISDLIGSTSYNIVLDTGTPILFIDRKLRSVGINCFPTNSSSIESQGLQLDDLVYVGSQELYPSFTTSEAGTTSLLGAYDYRLINGIFAGIIIPTGYVRAYRLTAQVQTPNENKVTVYINNIGTNSVGTWSGATFRNILASRIFKESEITLEETYGYTQKQGTNLKVNNSAAYACNVYAITLHAYLVKTDTNTVMTIEDVTPTDPA